MPDIAKIDSKRTVLLVMDYQAGVVGMIENADALVAAARRAIQTVRERGGRVGYVRVAFTEAEFESVPARNKGFGTLKTSGRTFHVDDPVTAIDRRVAPSDRDIVVRKTRVGAFSTTDLDRRLCELGIDTLVLAGISTSGVVLSTIRDAADRDYRLVVLSDACADPQVDVHALLMEKVFPRQADVIAAADLAPLLS